MTHEELEEYASHFLVRLGGDDGAYHALIEADHAILSILGRAFRQESDSTKRSQILNIIWQHRQQSSIPILAEALYDESESVWKEALDGLVTLAGPAAVATVVAAKERSFENETDRRYFMSFVTEALTQMANDAGASN